MYLGVMRPASVTLDWQLELSATQRPLCTHRFSGSSCACVKLTVVFLGGGAVTCGTLEIAQCCHILDGPSLCPLAVGWDFDSNIAASSERSWKEGKCSTRSKGLRWWEGWINIRNERRDNVVSDVDKRGHCCLGHSGLHWTFSRQFVGEMFRTDFPLLLLTV